MCKDTQTVNTAISSRVIFNRFNGLATRTDFHDFVAAAVFGVPSFRCKIKHWAKLPWFSNKR